MTRSVLRSASNPARAVWLRLDHPGFRDMRYLAAGSGVATQRALRSVASSICPSAASCMSVPAAVAISDVTFARTGVLAIRAAQATSPITLLVSG